MDHTGRECIPESVSLLHAHMHDDRDRVMLLQRHDGYGPSLEVMAADPDPDAVVTHDPTVLFESLPLLSVSPARALREL